MASENGQNKQRQQIEPQQQSENFCINPKNLINHLPLLETQIHNQAQIDDCSDMPIQKHQTESERSTPSMKPSIYDKKGKAKNKNISSLGNEQNFIHDQLLSRHQHSPPPVRKHRRGCYLDYRPSYQDRKKNWLNNLYFVRQKSMIYCH